MFVVENVGTLGHSPRDYTMNEKLGSSETILVGSRTSNGDQVVADDISRRIEYLTQNILEKIASSDDGWDVLFLDTDDSRYWELTYSDSDSHGGGAPTLKNLSAKKASQKYQV